MKKTILLLFCLVMALILAACSGEKADQNNEDTHVFVTEGETDPNAEVETPFISYAPPYYSIGYNGDAADLLTFAPSAAKAGDVLELKTDVLYDADIHVYVDGQEIGKSHYDSDYWGYSFIMPDNDVRITAEFYTKDEIWGTTTVDESVLREKYPEYFDLPTMKGLEVYVWQMAPNSWSCGIMEGTNRNKELEELMNLKGATIDEMKVILASYDIPKENIFIMPWQNPISSYLSEYWIIEENEDSDAVSKRRQDYVDKLREMLLGSEETGFIGSELRIRVNGQTVTYERHEAGSGSLTPKAVLCTFSEETEIEGIVWEVYSTEEYPDLSYVLVISGTNSCWTYRIGDDAATGKEDDYANLTEVNKVAYANWTDNNKIYASCLNVEKLIISSVRHFPVYKLDTKDDLDKFRDSFKDILTLDQRYNEIPSFNEAVSEYDDSFFAEHSLILAYVTAGSGSLRFDIRDVSRDGSSICLNVMQTNHPEVGTDDMAGWVVMSEVLDKALENITEYDAVLVPETNSVPYDAMLNLEIMNGKFRFQRIAITPCIVYSDTPISDMADGNIYNDRHDILTTIFRAMDNKDAVMDSSKFDYSHYIYMYDSEREDVPWHYRFAISDSGTVMITNNDEFLCMITISEEEMQSVLNSLQ